MELYQRIYVASSFLETEHGQIACEQCHGGRPDDDNWQTAHEGLVTDPTLLDADRVCGACHGDIVGTAKNSLHYTLAPMYQAVFNRAGGACCAPKTKTILKESMDRHCGACHSSCGQCHISRPDYVKGGFLAKHHFKGTPPMDTTCASCHGGRVHGEFTGTNEDFSPDVHFEDEEMTCMNCHGAQEMHADAQKVSSRYTLPEKPTCIQCHEEVLQPDGKNLYHTSHGSKLACQVCHSQASKSCFSCHVGTDKKGLPWFKCKKTDVMFKIGLNPDKRDQAPFEYVVVRHTPVVPDTFKFYIPSGLEQFSKASTWKRATPHNIIRKTSQTQTCNSCHGKPDLFLQKKDLTPEGIDANQNVIVPDDRIPGKILEK